MHKPVRGHRRFDSPCSFFQRWTIDPILPILPSAAVERVSAGGPRQQINWGVRDYSSSGHRSDFHPELIPASLGRVKPGLARYNYSVPRLMA